VWARAGELGALLALLVGSAGAQEAIPFEACIDSLRHELPRDRPVRRETFDAYVRDAIDLREPIRAAAENQPEFKLPVWDYIARLVDGQRVADGKDVLVAQAAPLQAIAARRGIDPATVVAVFGVETDYGRVSGRHRVLDATLSRACLDLSSKERKGQFFSALWLLQEGFVAPEQFKGSWAGAFGLTQFMPATFVAYKDSASGASTVDIINSVPDALATTAKFIASLGWRDAIRWGVEVGPLPKEARSLIAGEREHACLGSPSVGKCRSAEQWAAMGVRPIDAREGDAANFGWPRETRAALLAPAGPDGPRWLVTRNFQSIWQYNRADTYALAIGLLSDALRGAAPMIAAWPTDDPGLSRAQFRDVQRVLVHLGHVDVVVDGWDGPNTQAAIKAEERARGWPESGRAGVRLWQALAEPAQKASAAGR